MEEIISRNFSNAVSEGSKPVNEKGLFAGIDFKINNFWEISAYLDQFKFPWMRYHKTSPILLELYGFFFKFFITHLKN